MTSLSNPGTRRRTRLVWVVAIGVTVALSLLFRPRPRGEAEVSRADPASAAMPPLEPPPGSVAAELPPAPAAREPSDPPPGFDPRKGEYPVKLEALRARMPDNLYWRLGAPTSDPALLAERAEHARRMDALLGHITAGEASVEDIHAYFGEKRRESQDFLALAREALTTYGDDLSDRDRGLFELGARLHEARLAEVERGIADALERKRVQDERRAAWRAAGSPVPAKHD